LLSSMMGHRFWYATTFPLCIIAAVRAADILVAARECSVTVRHSRRGAPQVIAYLLAPPFAHSGKSSATGREGAAQVGEPVRLPGGSSAGVGHHREVAAIRVVRR
jgi:hypothetical protein